MPPMKHYRTFHKDKVPEPIPDFTWIPKEVWHIKGLSAGAKALYDRLLMHEQEGSPFPNISELAKSMRVSPRTIQKYLRALCSQGLLIEEEGQR